MGRRDWLLALGAGLCGGLLSACQHDRAATAGSTPEVAAVAAEAAAGRPPDRASLPDVPPPARPEPPAPPAPPACEEEGPRVEQARYPESATVPEPPPEPRRISFEPAPEPAPGKGPEAAAAPLVVTPAAGSGPAAEPVCLAAMRCFLDRQPAEAVERLKGLDRLSQEMLLGVLPLAAGLGEENLEQASPEKVAVLMDQLTGLQEALRPRAALAIDQICFCRHIDTFGVYDPLPDEHLFRAGEWALVYLELRNFTCEKRERGAGQPAYLTRLVSSAEVCDYAGHKVWPAGAERLVFRRQGPDESRTPWHDYFDSCSFRVPDLPPGRYTLWIQVEDVPTKRTVRRSLDFRVSAAVPGQGS